MTYPTGRGIHLHQGGLGGRNTHVYFTRSFPSRTLDLQIYREAIFISSPSSPSDPEIMSGTALESSAVAKVHRSQMEVWFPCLLHMPGPWPLQPSYLCSSLSLKPSLLCSLPSSSLFRSQLSTWLFWGSLLTFPRKLALSPAPLLCSHFTLAIIPG